MLQTLQGVFHDPLARLLVIRITEINPAPQGPRLPGRAQTTDLERATVRRNRAGKRRCRGQKILCLDATEEEDVSPFGEAATATTLLATWAGRLNLSVYLGVKSDKLFEDSRSHKRMTESRRVISSAGINSPVPAPGHTVMVRAQAAGLLTLLSQKGHVRHCRGRTA